MAAPHPMLCLPEFRFVLLGSTGEWLKKAFEEDCLKTANYQHDDPTLAVHRGNYGVCGGYADLHVIDCDDMARWQELDILPLIPPTFTIESRPGHRQFYMKCKDHFASGGLFDPEKKELDDKGKQVFVHIGDLKAGRDKSDEAEKGICGGYVVGPGCKHPSGSTYRVVDNSPIAEVSKAQLQVILLKFNRSKKVKPINQDTTKPSADWLGDMDKSASWHDDQIDALQVVDIMPPDGDVSRSGAELRGNHPVHGSTNGGNYVINTVKNVWSCKRCNSGGGAAAAIAVKHGLISCSDATPGELRGDLFKEVLKIAREKYGMADNNTPEEPKGPTVIDAFRAMLEHDSDVKTDKDGSTWEWRVWKPRIKHAVKSGRMSPKAEEKAHKFLGQYKKILKNFGIDYDNLFPLVPIAQSNKEEFSPEIKAKALNILKTCDPVQYITDSCKKMVLGADNAFKKLACCISVQNINQSAGLHPKLNGESSGGKTFTVYTFAHHMPKEAVIKGSMSAKAGFYHNDGNRVFRILDDYQAGNEDLDTVIKQTSSEFHSPYQHRTVVNHMAAVMEIGSEQTWAITSVDSSQEIQVLNRQLPNNVDDSIDLTIEVNKLTIKRYADGERQYPVTESVLVSRCILQILRDAGYIDVRIPFGDRIEWLDTTNRRNPSLFMDLVIAFTGMNRYQRERDSEGYYLATEDDFQAAKALFADKDGEELVKRLTKKEREALEFLVSRPDGITQDDLAGRLGVSRQRAGHILFGRDRERGGLMQKVQLQEERRSEMTKITEEHSQTIHKTIYSLKEYERFAGFEGVVRLNPQQGAHATHATPHATPSATKDTDTMQPHATNEIKKEKEREEREVEKRLQTSSPQKDPGFQENEKNGCNGCMGSADADTHGCMRGSEGLHEVGKAPVDANNHGCISSECGIGPRPRRDAPTPPKKVSSTTKEKVRIIKPDGYRTQIPLPDNPRKYVDHLYSFGEVVEQEHWKACELIKNGIAEAVPA